MPWEQSEKTEGRRGQKAAGKYSAKAQERKGRENGGGREGGNLPILEEILPFITNTAGEAKRHHLKKDSTAEGRTTCNFQGSPHVSALSAVFGPRLFLVTGFVIMLGIPVGAVCLEKSRNVYENFLSRKPFVLCTVLNDVDVRALVRIFPFPPCQKIC